MRSGTASWSSPGSPQGWLPTSQATLTGEPLPKLPPETLVRLRVEQVSTTDHATACGVARRTEAGATVLGPGLGRPIILTTLEIDEAMRILGSDQRRRLLAAAALLAATPVVLLLGIVVLILGR